jgi:hypothetical protein
MKEKERAIVRSPDIDFKKRHSRFDRCAESRERVVGDTTFVDISTVRHGDEIKDWLFIERTDIGHRWVETAPTCPESLDNDE